MVRLGLFGDGEQFSSEDGIAGWVAHVRLLRRVSHIEAMNLDNYGTSVAEVDRISGEVRARATYVGCAPVKPVYFMAGDLNLVAASRSRSAMG